MAAAESKLDDLLEDIQELEDFFFVLIPALGQRKLKHGEDVLGIAKEMKLKIPRSIEGKKVTWEAGDAKATAKQVKRRRDPLVFVRPGDPTAVGLTLGCVRVGKWKFCLECGWLYCRIVVTRRF